MVNTLNDKSRIFFNSLIVTTATVADKFFFFLITIIIARYLSVEKYGEYATALGYATFLAAFTNLGLNQVLIRQINLFPGEEKKHFANSLVLKLWVSGIAFIILIATLPFTGYNHNIIYLIIILAFVRLGSEFQNTFYYFYEAIEKFITSSFFTLVFSISLLAATIAAIKIKGDYYTIVFFRLALVAIFLIALFIYTQKKYNVVSLKIENLKGFIKDAIPFSLTTILQENAIGNINIIIISMMLGATYSGLFNNALLFFMALFFVPKSIGKVILPFLYKKTIEEDRTQFQFAYDIINRILCMLSFYILIILIFFPNEIITLLFGDKYIESAGVLKIIAISIPFFFNMGTTLITALDKQKINSLIYFIASLINVATSMILINKLKITGAAWAIVITYFFIFTASSIYLKKIFSIKILPTLLINLKLAIILAAIMFLYNYIILFDSWIINAIILSVIYGMLLFIFIVKKDDLRIFKEVLKNE
ncbi:MAG: oligosaccharide flippase family protein [Spirochaetota bacterium]